MPRILPYLPLLACLFSPVPPALADGEGPSFVTAGQDEDYKRGRSAIEAKDWKAAIAAMSGVVERQPDNANAWNWLGYAWRQSGDLQQAFKYYDKALRIDPAHRGAHEYAGEAWLQAGDLARAQEHLKALDKLCWLPCEEYRDL
ncbi:MAG: tetratricopeptide repeat protein, partial [Rhodocyclaceae bacterium]|nr:tetratricopeptide repeat protein [Rhodocyclaceae bacterium]